MKLKNVTLAEIISMDGSRSMQTGYGLKMDDHGIAQRTNNLQAGVIMTKDNNRVAYVHDNADLFEMHLLEGEETLESWLESWDDEFVKMFREEYII